MMMMMTMLYWSVVVFFVIVFFCLEGIEARSCYKSRNLYNSTSGGFFDAFNFETFDDPTHGYVDFVNFDTAKSMGLVSYTSSNQIYIGTDYVNQVQNGERGRKAIRLSSKQYLTGRNLLVLDLDHMPTTVGKVLPAGCSVWPAFWTVGDNWPNNGEIDIIEYVNEDSTVASTLHTNSGCDQESEDKNSFSGSWSLNPSGGPNDNCDVNAPDQYANTGCSIMGPPNTVGKAFNTLDSTHKGKGGIYVMEWDGDDTNQSNRLIRTFFFARDQIPSDLLAHNPNPDSWDKPYARFSLADSTCAASHFKSHQVVFDTTFCGDWAGAVYPYTCSSSLSCTDFVQNNPQEFSEAYWLINYMEVYDTC